MAFSLPDDLKRGGHPDRAPRRALFAPLSIQMRRIAEHSQRTQQSRYAPLFIGRDTHL
ncbi:hypothetical protein BVI1335_70081 [Burkholderia vietnamiensis]|nr:hypothetical protein BVI1335_70081 [Burkholderia vietnamiensis]